MLLVREPPGENSVTRVPVSISFSHSDTGIETPFSSSSCGVRSTAFRFLRRRKSAKHTKSARSTSRTVTPMPTPMPILAPSEIELGFMVVTGVEAEDCVLGSLGRVEVGVDMKPDMCAFDDRAIYWREECLRCYFKIPIFSGRPVGGKIRRLYGWSNSGACRIGRIVRESREV
ncbi:hypothetical protein GQ43DRAFT_76328 [Delitschia confertaspora ATCC 74209]|uniref:Uncharacterized protein n=1 Tax=Delitschia confertaspora ATCC 74209 TaxID=1513339 RepID=A0A9P4JVA1_9PLEO|nr:hypothetical protein GQ43DRAFT_76328 [Delitschia confertaspora ATCC 74209]